MYRKESSFINGKADASRNIGAGKALFKGNETISRDHNPGCERLDIFKNEYFSIRYASRIYVRMVRPG
jgi:hypothetical protein